MKKRIGIIIVFIMMFTSSFSTISAAEVTPMTENKLETVNKDIIITPRSVISYPKTITRTYSTYSDIPSVYPYSEYNLGSWFHGYLDLEKVERQSNGQWLATFSGMLTGSI